MASRKDKYYLVSLGCSKNTVDCESMAQVLNQNGMIGVTEPNKAEVLIVNTCGFIDSAKQESIDTLRELVDTRRSGQMVIAAGCLSQRYGADLVQEVPGLDGVIGTRRWMDIFDLVARLRVRKHPEPLYHLPTRPKSSGLDEHGVLRASVQGASAYLKIADGCRRPCAFCAIPKIKGTMVSRPTGLDCRGSRPPASDGRQRSHSDRAGHQRLRLGPGHEGRHGASAGRDCRRRAGYPVVCASCTPIPAT